MTYIEQRIFQRLVQRMKIRLGVYTDLLFSDTITCSDGFLNLQNKYCIKVFRTRKTWSDAMKECFRQGAKLFAPEFMSTILEALNKIEGGSTFKGGLIFKKKKIQLTRVRMHVRTHTHTHIPTHPTSQGS